MIRADGSSDGRVTHFENPGSHIGLTIDQDGWAHVQRGGVTYQVSEGFASGGGNFGGGYVPEMQTDELLMPLRVGTPEVTINSWRTRDCGDECSQQGSGSVYHYEEAELSNGDTIEINYRIAPNQSTRFLTPDAIHQYLRRIVERERGRAEDRLADLEMIERRLP